MILFWFKYFIRVKTDDNISGEFELIFIKFSGGYGWFNKVNILIECFFIDFHELWLLLSIEIIVDNFGEFINFGCQVRVCVFFFEVAKFFISLFRDIKKEIIALRAVRFNNLKCLGTFGGLFIGSPVLDIWVII